MNNTSINCEEILARFPPPPPRMSMVVKSLYCVFILVFSLITLTGNAFVIASVAMVKTLQKRTHAFVVAVACADIGVAIFVMPFRLYEEWNGGWLLGESFCLTVNMFDGVFCSVSMCTLCCLAIERYLAVCRPFLHAKIKPSLVIIIIAVCWSLPIAGWGIFLFNQYHIVGIEDFVFCVLDGACPLITNLVSTLVLGIVPFWLPLLVMTFCYVRIFVTANRHIRVICETTITDADRRLQLAFTQKMKAAKTLGIVIGCFLVCWLPFFIVVTGDAVEGFQWSVQLKISVTWLGYLNSMMNPFLYYIFSSEFKAAFRSIVKCMRGYSDDRLGYSSNTISS
ncbi:trace amine-associated receptor 13c-like [Gigantopelta aegis]|uniref:trace amine-associated receptor 13c-like n=1 Tax=Gigantopelta aegis TaxID=1735272 RepID=UPI001B888F51|nr:trace amine-associated receptor 13c-like [Gigantopelta aegis]